MRAPCWGDSGGQAATVAWILVLSCLAGPAEAEPFRSITPGTSVRADVIEAFGEPSRVVEKGDLTVIAYFGRHAIPGAKQVQFRITNATKVVQRVDVFPPEDVDLRSLENTFGPPCERAVSTSCHRRVPASDKKGFILGYPGRGLALFLDAEGHVASVIYTPAKAAAKPAPPSTAVANGGAPTPPVPADTTPGVTPPGPAAGSVASEQVSTGGEKQTSLLESLGLTNQFRVGVWSASQKLDRRGPLVTGRWWLKFSPNLGSYFGLVVEGWLANEQLPRRDQTLWRLRDAYLRFTAGPLDLRVGQQLIVWGRADGINPTDNLSPRNYTLLVPYDSEQRWGVPSAKANVTVGTFSLTGVWLPYFSPTVVPLNPVPAPLTYGSDRDRFSLRQAAVKLQQEGATVDWSVSYFAGLDLLPDLRIDLTQPGEVLLGLEHHPIQVFGADAATTLGPLNLRAEAAYIRTSFDTNTDPLTLIQRPFASGVVGGDESFLSDHLNLNVQYVVHYVLEYSANPWAGPPPLAPIATSFAAYTNQLTRLQHGGTARVALKFREDTLQVELTGAFFVDPFNYYARALLSYAITDEWKLLLGGNYFGGPAASFYGRLHDNAAAFGELRWTF